MCRYWQKLHICTHMSDWRYIEMCHSGFLANVVCPDIGMDPNPRQSYFPCWQCIKQSARTEKLEQQALVQAAIAAAEAAREQAFRLKIENDKRIREERVRREAREQAERERAAEQQLRAEREIEKERTKKEGGLWTLAESGSGKKKKGKGFVSTSLVGPTIPPFLTNMAKKNVWKENGKAGRKESEKGAESSGRAGIWGAKKILSRKEGAAGLLGERADNTAEPKEKE